MSPRAFLDLFHTTLRKQLDPDQPGETELRPRGAAYPAVRLHRRGRASGAVRRRRVRAHAGRRGGSPEMTAEAMQEMGEAVARIFAAAAPGLGWRCRHHARRGSRGAAADARRAGGSVSRLYAEISEQGAGVSDGTPAALRAKLVKSHT